MTAGAIKVLLIGIMIIYAMLVVLVLMRAVIGPRVADRLMAINMVGTIGIFLMAVISVMLNEDYLLDVSIIYAMISFLSVVILTKVYMGVHEENVLKRHKIEREKREQGIKADDDEWDKLLKSIEETEVPTQLRKK
ncbi:MAG: sodium:proton antiporter [Lachnospiraceae bacterium]|nr:sodium:proton antiporter [Lachnospiraceae bacterium]